MTRRVKRHNDLARFAAMASREHHDLELLLEPALLIYCFRYGVPGIEYLDSFNRHCTEG